MFVAVLSFAFISAILFCYAISLLCINVKENTIATKFMWIGGFATTVYLIYTLHYLTGILL